MDAGVVDATGEEPSSRIPRANVAAEAKRLRRNVLRESERAVERGARDALAVQVDDKVLLIPRQACGRDFFGIERNV